ncbi:transporter substrate-binding domain-containing protein [Nostoc sp.]|uniref:transporter substrate-binding domain-containing protein n=1 Tax=Nostoc sp. TaxID=1180 RepID=UPI003FA5C614
MKLINVKWQQLILSLGCLLLIIACKNFYPTKNPDAIPLRVATDPTFVPFEIEKASGDLEGFDIDLMNAIGKVAGFSVQFESLPFDGTISTLQAKRVDAAISGITITPERLKTIAFSRPYFKAGLAIAVREDNQNIQDFNSLKGKKIAVQIGSTGADFAKTIPNAKISTFNSGPEFFQDLPNRNIAMLMLWLAMLSQLCMPLKMANLKALELLPIYLLKNTTALLHLKTPPIWMQLTKV